eukprot:CAMPEP_0170496532 /NCGR_PEP_ID=MMETSP0208-20121228/21967_1 /TAXON_ID=197538 /ORGANISM="Strombidium inclinatum, Strain S3" /LENGTH=178 /DNA_ID=CAMNT_0010773103 /DNA_START=676 /DNA_END=1212 /DNA_ORIENTATION=-
MELLIFFFDAVLALVHLELLHGLLWLVIPLELSQLELLAVSLEGLRVGGTAALRLLLGRRRACLFVHLLYSFRGVIDVYVFTRSHEDPDQTRHQQEGLHVECPPPADVVQEARAQAVAHDHAQGRGYQQVRQPLRLLEFVPVDISPDGEVDAEEHLEQTGAHAAEGQQGEPRRQGEQD